MIWLSYRDVTVPEVIENMRFLRPSSEPRQYWQYNNQHYVLLSRIVTTLTGIPYPDWVKQNIFEPLGMISSTYNVTEAWTSGRSTDAHLRVDRNLTKCAEMWSGVGKIDESCTGITKSIGSWIDGDFLNMAGAGGVATTPKDLVCPARQLC
jgi:CubicO group peptidase (beta-lactamase class C family)